MAVTPKSSASKPVRKTVAKPKATSTLSASEALKAAEAAITPAPVKKAPVRKPKPDVAKEKPAVEASETAIIAATTAMDAAPEPPIEDKEEALVETPVTKLTSAKPISEPSTLSAPVPVIEGTKMMNDVIETGKKFAEETKAKLETAYADLNEKAKVSVEKSTKALEEMSDIAKGNVEALVESGKIAAKGLETMGQEAVDYTKKSFEKATASFKSFSTVKTPTEFFQLQSQLFSSSFDEFTKEAAKSSEAMMKLAGDVAQPLTARVTLVTDKVKALAA
ncbi:hypothetical protein GGR44_001846 [Sphingobium fontiphilum]|uniref:Phasin domain-containing protein n=1 Tax=Sphingobium fontiphilum TaxID=944425 RepID=A0A7W6GP50_9SPHN|nr:hypothetical protein [Sphingobium fontiphilum]